MSFLLQGVCPTHHSFWYFHGKSGNFTEKRIILFLEQKLNYHVGNTVKIGLNVFILQYISAASNTAMHRLFKSSSVDGNVQIFKIHNELKYYVIIPFLRTNTNENFPIYITHCKKTKHRIYQKHTSNRSNELFFLV